MHSKEFYGLFHIGITCTNLERSILFYENILGFYLEFVGKVNGYRLANLVLDNMIIELIEMTGDAEQIRASNLANKNHIAICVRSLNAIVERLKAVPGVSFEFDEPRRYVEYGRNDLSYIFFRGLDGERFELIDIAR